MACLDRPEKCRYPERVNTDTEPTSAPHRLRCKERQAQRKPYKLTDFDGLYLYVSAQGSRLWRYDYRFAGKRKTASFGIYPEVTLAGARQARDTARQMLKDGRDPVIVKQVEKARINGTLANTFESVARDWHEARKATWRADHAV